MQGGIMTKKPQGLTKYFSAAIMAGMHIDPYLFQKQTVLKKKKRRHIKSHK